MNKQKFCSFYASDVHLVTMLLPYINKKINENKEIITIFETSISESAKKVIESINLKEFRKEKLLEIDWSSRENIDGMKLDNKIVLIMGNNEYIKNMNTVLDNINEEFLIINCYEFMQSENSIEEILDLHEKIVNSSGENEIEEIFTQYTRKINKKITIMK